MATILVADDKGGSRQALQSLFGVTSRPGAGTVFEIYLPAGDGRARRH